MLKDFRDFAIEGGAIGLMTGGTAGAASGTFVSSLVDDVLVPVTGLILGRADTSNMSVVPNNPNSIAVSDFAAANEAGGAALTIGLFINAVVKFVIVAFVLCLVVKAINATRKQQAAAQPA